MIDNAMDQFIARYLPLAQHMQLAVQDYNGKVLSLQAPLAPNINDKQTAFGGSLYCAAVMSCWGMVYLRSLDYGLEPDIVVVKAEIEYLKPVAGDIVTTTREVEESRWTHFFSRYEERGRAKIDLGAEICVEGEVAVRFNGMYAIVGVK